MDAAREYESEFQADITASELVESNMDTYARHVLLNRLPHHIDGLKLIHRRILMVLGTTEDKLKGSALIGRVMGTYHPHGDASIYDAIIRLAQPFNQVFPYVKVFGNVGDYSGEMAAAARYIDVTSSEFSRDLFFNRTNLKTLTFIPSETGVGREPAYFIPAIPTALIMGAHTIGVGVKSVIPYLELSNVCSLVEKYIQIRQKFPFNHLDEMMSLYKYLIPDTPTHSLLRNEKDLLIKYADGRFKEGAMMDGIMELYPDCIHIRTIPYGRCLKDALSKIEGLFKTANVVSASFQEVSDISTGFEYGNIKLPLKRGVDPFDVIEDLKKVIWFTVKQSYLWNFTDMDGSLLELNPYTLIDKWYDERCRSILGDLKYSRDALFKQYRRLMALVVVADHTDDVLSIFKESSNREATIPPLCKRFRLTENQAQYLSSLQMHQITRQGKDELLKDLDVVKGRIKELQTKFTDIDNIIVQDADYIKNKYRKLTPRRLKYHNFLGAIEIPESGFIQFESMEELAKLAKRWDRSNFKIHGYPKGSMTLHTKIGMTSTCDSIISHPKEFKADAIYAHKAKPKYTIHLRDKTIFRTSGFYLGTETDTQNTPVYDTFLALDSKNILLQYRATAIAKRRSLTAEGVRTDIVHVSPVQDDMGIVVYVNTRKANCIVFELLKSGEKMAFPGIGKLHIYGIYAVNDSLVFTIEPKHSYRCSVKHLYITDLRDIMLDDTRVECYLNRRNCSNGVRLKPIVRKSDIYGV